MRADNSGMVHTDQAKVKFRIKKILANEFEAVKSQGVEQIYQTLVGTFENRLYPGHDDQFDAADLQNDPFPPLDQEMLRNFYDYERNEVQYTADMFPRQEPGPYGNNRAAF